MQYVTQSPESFYGTPQGHVCATLVGERMRWLWPDLHGLHVAGMGWAGPCLAQLDEGGGQYVAINGWSTTTRLAARAGRLYGVPACEAEITATPFRTGAFDRVVLVHALRGRDNPLPALREAARIMREDGRLLLAVPSRLLGCSRLHGTAFAQDRAFTRRAVRRVLAAAMLRAERWDELLFMPAWLACRSVSGGRRMDVAGKVLCPGAGGVLLVEAVHDLYSARPLPVTGLRRWLARAVMPQPGAARRM